MEKKKKGFWILKLLGLLFVLYLSLTIAMEAGYYEAIMAKDANITKEAMQKFEEDVKNGKEVDIKDYIVDSKKDYSNSTTKAGVFVSGIIEDFMSDGISQMVELFKKLFT